MDYPEAEEGVQPRHRFMSAYEQRVEAPDKNYQYLLVACEPYETVTAASRHGRCTCLCLSARPALPFFLLLFSCLCLSASFLCLLLLSLCRIDPQATR